MTRRRSVNNDAPAMPEAPLSKSGVWITRIVLLLIVLAVAGFLLLR